MTAERPEQASEPIPCPNNCGKPLMSDQVKGEWFHPHRAESAPR
jgi:hypothetical protein